MSRPLEQLVQDYARIVLSDETRWTCGAWARDRSGSRCDPLSPDAVRWCAVGALEVAAFRLLGDKVSAKRIAKRIAKSMAPGPGGLVYLNECGAFKEIQAAFSSRHPSCAPSYAVFERRGFAAFSRMR